MTTEKKLLIFDGNSILNRAYFALPPMFDKQGRNVNAVFGFTKILNKAIAEYKPDCFAVAFDKRGRNFRKDLYEDYKANRHGMPDDLASQLPILHNLLNKMNVQILEEAGVEADDIIGSVVNNFNLNCLIVSGDRDLLQLVNNRVSVVLTKKGISETEVVTPKILQQSYQLTASQVIDYKALKGDPSDNIPGVLGIGEKTALSLIAEFQNIENLYANIDKLKGAVKEKLENGKQMAFLSKKLATIVTTLETPCCEGDFCLPVFNEEVKQEFLELKFLSLIDSFSSTEPQKEATKAEIVEVSTLSQLQAVVSELEKSPTVAVHFEENIVWLANCVEKEYKVIRSQSFLDDLSDHAVFQSLKQLFGGKVKKIVFDVKNLSHMLLDVDIKLNNAVFDVSLMQYLTEQSSVKRLSDLLKLHNLANFASGLFALNDILQKKLMEMQLESVYQNIELPLSDLLFRMETEGVAVDTEVLKQLSDEYKEKIQNVSKEIFELTGEVFNISSPKQLSVILFEKLNLKHSKKTATGFSTNNEVLEKLLNVHPVIEKIITYRSLTKLFGTYIEGLRQILKRGVVHTTYNQFLTTTGRLSSSEPNLQNIPVRDEQGKEIRKLFVSKYGKFVAADYSQIELRVLAEFSGDQNLLRAFKSDTDIHKIVASEIFGVPVEMVSSQMRRTAKAVNFGIIYGQGAFGLSENIKVSVAKAKQYIDAYFKRFPSIKAYLDSQVALAKKEGFVKTFIGRRRYLPEINSSNFQVRSFGERAAMNMPLQGSAADIMKIAMLKVDQAIKNNGLESKIVMQVHDELIVDCKENEVEKVKELLKQEMEHAVEFSCPLTVEIDEGGNLFEV